MLDKGLMRKVFVETISRNIIFWLAYSFIDG
jgi:hypothetical protein